VGGFALSQYLTGLRNRESLALRGELEAQVAQISATAARLERATLSEQNSTEREVADRRGAEGVPVTTTIGPCHGHAGIAPASEPVACTEQEALPVTLCASVPARAVVVATDLYARPEDSPQSWSESQVAFGQDVGRARFADKAFERLDSDQAKLVCTVFSSWNGAETYTARLVVKYVVAPMDTTTPNTSAMLTSSARP
jgi:hypothetical protein